jgi:hypothetical protein
MPGDFSGALDEPSENAGGLGSQLGGGVIPMSSPNQELPMVTATERAISALIQMRESIEMQIIALSADLPKKQVKKGPAKLMDPGTGLPFAMSRKQHHVRKINGPPAQP